MTNYSVKRVMFDTNVLFSAMYKFEGTPFDAFAKASEMPYRLVLCDQIIDELRRNFNRKFPANIDRIILFGSYATGKYQPGSDIDIAVSLNEMPDIKQRRLYTQAVDMDQEINLLFCSKEQLLSNTFVYRHINEQGVVFYEQL